MRRALPLALATLALGGAGCGSSSKAERGSVIKANTPKSPFKLGSTFPHGFLGKPAARIRLADARGGRFDTASLRGKPFLVTFLYTRCPDVCPLIGIELKSALSELGAKGRDLRVVAVSVDPRHDTQAAVRRWLRTHGEPSSFHYLIGSPEELRPVWKAYYAAPQRPGDPNSAHTAIIWLVDRHGRMVGGINAGQALPTDPLVHDLATLAST